MRSNIKLSLTKIGQQLIKRHISRQTKLFRVSRLSQFSISKNTFRVKVLVRQKYKLFDLIVFSDFQYGY